MSCKALGMSISTYYYKVKITFNEDQIIKKEIEKIIETLPESGYRPVTVLLNRNGFEVNHKRAHRIMKENGLLCRKSKRYVHATTDSRHEYMKYPNIAKDVVTDDINQVIVGDVTAYDVKGKDHFLAQLMDRHNREVIGKAVSDKNDTALMLSALEDANKNRDLKGCIHHTDADVRYCSKDYIARLKEIEMKISMCVGNAYENAHAESLNKTVKRQEINISDYDNKEESAISIFRYFEVYNNYRPHSSIGNMTPVEYRMALEDKKNMEITLQL
jgi:transposase InsO family protein